MINPTTGTFATPNSWRPIRLDGPEYISINGSEVYYIWYRPGEVESRIQVEVCVCPSGEVVVRSGPGLSGSGEYTEREL